DVVAGVVVSPDLVAWVHPAPISANPVIAAENTAVRFVIARITSPVELDRTSTPTHPNGDAMRVRNHSATNHTALGEPERRPTTQRGSKAITAGGSAPPRQATAGGATACCVTPTMNAMSVTPAYAKAPQPFWITTLG